MISKQTLVLAGAVGIGAFILSETVMTAREKKRARTTVDVEAEEKRIQEVRIQAMKKIRDARLHENPAATIMEEKEFVKLEVDRSELKIPDEKPDISQVVQENVFDRDPTEIEIEEEREAQVEEALEKIGKTKWGTEALHIGEDGYPKFSEEQWAAEEAGIELISQDEFAGDSWPLYDRDQAIWYPGDGVLADQGFQPMEVVDTVGPTALLTMLKNPDSIVYVRNDGLEKCYELWENDVDFEKALEDSGFEVDVRLE